MTRFPIHTNDSGSAWGALPFLSKRRKYPTALRHDGDFFTGFPDKYCCQNH